MAASVIAFPGCVAPSVEPMVEQWQANMILHAIRLVTNAKNLDRNPYYAGLCRRFEVEDMSVLPAAHFIPFLREMQALWWEGIEQRM